MIQHSRICAQIDLDCFEHNLDEIERLISPETKICAVIKTDGYGHGALPLAEVMEGRESVWGYAVATVDEAVELNEAGFLKPLLILGYVFEEDYDTVIDLGIRPTLISTKSAQDFSEAAQKAGKTLRVHVKVDTGMSRIGFPCTEDLIEETANEISRIAAMPCIEIEGIFTHFAEADHADKAFSKKQADRFFALLDRLDEMGIDIPLCHISNSAGIIDLPQYDLDLVRAGIILYGLWPSDEVKHDRIDLKPLMTLKSHVVQVKTIEAGVTVSYGRTYQASERETIATIPVGYGDGYPRTLSNLGYVLIHGQRAPICGRVCMDQFMVNVTAIDSVKAGDEVILLGRDGAEEITMEQLGEMSGRFNYEFACDIGKRVPRVYVRSGRFA
ncbi:MAG: alanine racemase [Lachnospiraceae bacterium]|nr:alanine racemase [Lachnospiraceae bacterium]